MTKPVLPSKSFRSFSLRLPVNFQIHPRHIISPAHLLELVSNERQLLKPLNCLAQSSSILTR